MAQTDGKYKGAPLLAVTRAVTAAVVAGSVALVAAGRSALTYARRQRSKVAATAPRHCVLASAQ